MAEPNLHDATFLRAELDWGARTVVLRFDRSDGIVTLTASNVTEFLVPHRDPWGPSVSVNVLLRAGNRLEIEMQSGDVIEVEDGKWFEFSGDSSQ